MNRQATLLSKCHPERSEGIFRRLYFAFLKPQKDTAGTEMKSEYYVYIISGPSETLYTGMTNDLERRIYEHKHKLIKGYSSRFNLDRLLYFEIFNPPIDAITAEKKIKGWLRERKLNLIRTMNPEFKDLSEE